MDFFSKSLVPCFIKKPKNGLLPTFSPDLTWNRQIWLFYPEKWIFFKKFGTLLNVVFCKFGMKKVTRVPELQRADDIWPVVLSVQLLFLCSYPMEPNNPQFFVLICRVRYQEFKEASKYKTHTRNKRLILGIQFKTCYRRPKHISFRSFFDHFCHTSCGFLRNNLRLEFSKHATKAKLLFCFASYCVMYISY